MFTFLSPLRYIHKQSKLKNFYGISTIENMGLKRKKYLQFNFSTYDNKYIRITNIISRTVTTKQNWISSGGRAYS